MLTANPSALELAAAIKTKQVSPVEVIKHYLAVVDRVNPIINAIIWRRDAELLNEAKAAENAVMRGDVLAPFHGVPLPIKDLTEVKGERTTHGTVAAKAKIGRYDTTPVRLLREAGFLFMGRTNTPEFGSLPVTENTLYGATRNPWNTNHTPGGSSGGASAAVASGMAPIAHGSDGGGSLRIPASCCGLVGLKPSRGRIPKGPLVSEVMHGFTTDGCQSMTVADTAAYLDALAKYDPTGWNSVQEPSEPYVRSALRGASGKGKRLRIGFTCTGPYSVNVAQSCIDAVTKTATILASLGHEVSAVTPTWPGAGSDQLAEDFVAIWCTSAAYQDVSDWSLVEPLSASLRQMSLELSSHDYIKAVLRLQVFSRQIVRDWGKDYDLLLTPTMAMEPPRIGWLHETGETDAKSLLWRCTEMVPYSGWCNVTGQPAISLPMHVAASGLPIGVQLAGPPYREDLLLEVGAELEAAVSWRDSLPVQPVQSPRT